MDTASAAVFQNTEIIDSYSRKQAIDDGFLIDVSEEAKKACFICPVAITSALHTFIDPTEKEQKRGESFAGRLWDILTICRYLCRKKDDSQFIFEVMIMKESNRKKKYYDIKAVAAPGDQGELTITLMLPEES